MMEIIVRIKKKTDEKNVFVKESRYGFDNNNNRKKKQTENRHMTR